MIQSMKTQQRIMPRSDADERLDQTPAQFLEVLEERHLVAGFLIDAGVRRVSHAVGLSVPHHAWSSG